MTQDNKLTGPYDVIINFPDGRQKSLSFSTPSTSGAIATSTLATAQNAGIIISAEQANIIKATMVNSITSIDDLASSQEKEEKTVVNEYEIGLNFGIFKAIYRRKTTTKK
jgi:hypothetical protein